MRSYREWSLGTTCIAMGVDSVEDTGCLLRIPTDWRRWRCWTFENNACPTMFPVDPPPTIASLLRDSWSGGDLVNFPSFKSSSDDPSTSLQSLIHLHSSNFPSIIQSGTDEGS
jgi:hypothetical protein